MHVPNPTLPRVAGVPQSLPYGVKKTGRILLDQQLWCLGCDLRDPARWLLSFPGMRPVRRPPGVHGSARVDGDLAGGGHLSLWGFGVVAVRPGLGAIFLRRYGFFPFYRPPTTPTFPAGLSGKSPNLPPPPPQFNAKTPGACWRKWPKPSRSTKPG